MNGVWLGQKAIRVNWANQKPIQGTGGRRADLDQIMSLTSPYNTSVYVGNLTPDVTDAMLRQEFSSFGQIQDVKVNEKGFGFVNFTSHEAAARAILVNNGIQLGGKQIRCSWGKDKAAPGSQPGGFFPGQQAMPQYGAYPSAPAPGGYGGYPQAAPSYGGYPQAGGYGGQYGGAPAQGGYPQGQYGAPTSAAPAYGGYPAGAYGGAAAGGYGGGYGQYPPK